MFNRFRFVHCWCGAVFIALGLGVCAHAQDAESVQARVARACEKLPVVRIEDPKPLEHWMDRYNIPGVSVAVIEDFQLAGAAVFGVRDAASGEPVTSETLFQAASISKPVTAVGLLSLVEDDEIVLEYPVSDYLRSYRIPPHNFGEQPAITFDLVLSHLAGFNVSSFDGYRLGEEIPTTLGILVGKGNSDPVQVARRPGGRFQYSGGGFMIVQMVMEDITNRSFADVMAEHVLEPVGMSASTFEQPLPSRLAGRAATAHDRDGKSVTGGWHIYPEQAAAGLWSTPSDLCRFGASIQRAIRGDGGEVLKPDTAKRYVIPVKGGDYGLGCHLYKNYFDHVGTNMGFRNYFFVHTSKGYGAVIMTNGHNGAKLIDEVTDAIIQEYGWDELEPLQ